MRLPDSVHTSRPWRVHELVSDFRLEDVRALPTPGGPDDFPRLVYMLDEEWAAEIVNRTVRAAGVTTPMRCVDPPLHEYHRRARALRAEERAMAAGK